ncbi:MAG: hypothetical protein GXY42_13830 [Desulfovibrionales bacterium]|nr:hypothetical protein [Desulfovibrionales bacterium]
MWIDDLSLLRLEEVDWKIGHVLDELSVTARDEDFLEFSGFENDPNRRAEPLERTAHQET